MIRKENEGNHARDPSAPIKFTDRLKHFTWANFTLTMSTGGLALLLGVQPHTFSGLVTIGKAVYIFNLVLFVLTCSAIVYRFVKYRGTFKPSLLHPTESLFMPTSLLSLASIISAIPIYGIPATGQWLVEVYIVLFWLYFTFTFVSAVAQYYYLFSRPQFTIQGMVPSWILPIFPFMLCDTMSGSGARFMSPTQAMSVIVGGLTAQGLGMLVAFLMYGFLEARAVPKRKIFKILCHLSQDQFSIISIQEHKQYDDLKEPVNKRAWTLQEQLFSPWLLTYASHTLQWQCSTTTCNHGDSYHSPNLTAIPKLPAIAHRSGIA